MLSHRRENRKNEEVRKGGIYITGNGRNPRKAGHETRERGKMRHRHTHTHNTHTHIFTHIAFFYIYHNALAQLVNWITLYYSWRKERDMKESIYLAFFPTRSYRHWQLCIHQHCFDIFGYGKFLGTFIRQEEQERNRGRGRTGGEQTRKMRRERNRSG